MHGQQHDLASHLAWAAPEEPSLRAFLGGLSVAARVYAPGLPAGWSCPEQPGFGQTGGRLGAYVAWATALVRAADGPVHLAGHSLGAAVAIATAASEPGRVARLTVFAPPGLPASGGGLRAAARDVLANGLAGRLGARTATGAALRMLDHPLAALRLARALVALDLRRELARVDAAGIRLDVIGAAGDRVAVPRACRRLAELGGGRYLEDAGGRDHLWVLTEPRRLARYLDC
jgi:pimeloyl-ACP methyl ester carboxylesterase